MDERARARERVRWRWDRCCYCEFMELKHLLPFQLHLFLLCTGSIGFTQSSLINSQVSIQVSSICIITTTIRCSLWSNNVKQQHHYFQAIESQMGICIQWELQINAYNLSVFSSLFIVCSHYIVGQRIR